MTEPPTRGYYLLAGRVKTGSVGGLIQGAKIAAHASEFPYVLLMAILAIPYFRSLSLLSMVQPPVSFGLLTKTASAGKPGTLNKTDLEGI